MIQFSNPIVLWALSGLSIPIGIHLLSRKDGKVIQIGSLRHLQETNTQQFKGIQLNEIILLILRCLLIIIFVFLISGMNFNSLKKKQALLVLIEKGLENNKMVTSQLENLQKQGYEPRWLADGFPPMKDSLMKYMPLAYWEIAHNLKDHNFSNAIVFSKNKIGGFKGLRQALQSNIQWFSIPSDPLEYTLSTISIHDSVMVRTGHSSSDKTYFTNQTFSVHDVDTFVESILNDTIVIVAEKSYQLEKKIVLASLKAINQSIPAEFTIVQSSLEKIQSTGYGDWCIWLTNQAISDSVFSKVIYVNLNFSQNVLAQVNPTRWAISKQLNEEIALNENFTVNLAATLTQTETMIKFAAENDNRMLPDSIAWRNSGLPEKGSETLQLNSAESYLLALLLLTLLIERILAYQRNQ